ncbi:tRNA1(Val) (adenine(37)-N6)-methyltransferase [Urechidicola vernalis]|uniref:tRNA1(Val) (adenine(37)-N6)-methyltransferase n=1 Tax=Urechidicola vernalis TaxID=3075600 RepID=A0ABU2Y6W3_9FLAO|nr:methyltransferase [Urechidicola sp. P050]MDT0553515.1 methyltransferase [Urechidicola sp. P050]
MSSEFRFKQFTIRQEHTAMKVGTDGVLLGAWAQPKEAFSILDIGTGTGLIALQLAQKTYAEVVDALEIEGSAYEQAVENFEQSDWGDRLFCYHASFNEFVSEMEGEEYDFIISNPPFYTSTVKEDTVESARVKARHVESLSYEELIEGTTKLLSEKGECAFIIPFKEEVSFLEIASNYNLFPNRITRVKGTEKAEIKRSLLQLSFQEVKRELSELVIEIERHVYTKEYIDLVEDFYLKM